jgi:hypothetical protein
LNGGGERGDVFGVTCGNPTPPLQAQKDVFNPMA